MIITVDAKLHQSPSLQKMAKRIHNCDFLYFASPCISFCLIYREVAYDTMSLSSYLMVSVVLDALTFITMGQFMRVFKSSATLQAIKVVATVVVYPCQSFHSL